MRIVIDMQGAQTESRLRGIGNYSYGLTKSIIKNNKSDEIIIVLNNLLKESIDEIHKEFKDLINPKNIIIWNTPENISSNRNENLIRKEIAILIREAFLYNLKPDVVHVLSLFEGFVDDAAVSIGEFDKETPVISTCFDFIPLMNANIYLDNNPLYKNFYYKQFNFLKKASRLVTISESSFKEAEEVLKDNNLSFIKGFVGIEDHFKKLDLTEEEIKNFKKKFNINNEFLMYCGGSDGRKNLDSLVNSYISLDKNLQDIYQLILVGNMPESDKSRLKNIVLEAGLNGEKIIFTGFVSNDELVRFYNIAKLFILPSLHEGFGLVALEAFACGTAVICGNTTSMPEVVDNPSALFDPTNIDSISNKISQVLNDNELLEGIKKKGLEQVKKFQWINTVKKIYQAYNEISKDINSQETNWDSIKTEINQNNEKLLSKIKTILESDSQNTLLTEVMACIEKNTHKLKQFYRSLLSLPVNFGWLIEGPFETSYSLALVNRELARSLISLNKKVLLSEECLIDPHKVDDIRKNSDLKDYFLHSSDENPNISVISRNTYPPEVKEMDALVNFYHSYHWEETQFPFEYVEGFNKSLQGLTVGSKNILKIMIDNGVTIPIFNVGDGIDHWVKIKEYNSEELNYRCGYSKSFRFLHVSSCFPRKGADILLKSYGKSFTKKDDVTLIIKTFKNPHNTIHSLLKKERSQNANYPEVIIIEDDFSAEKLKSLYSICDCLIAPSRGEGFGLPLAEAMLSGLGVITTNWGGQLDFCNNETSWLIDYKFIPAKSHMGLFDSVMAEPDVDHLAILMKEFYNLPKSKKITKAIAAKKLLMDSFTWNKVANKTLQSISKFANQDSYIEPKIGWISTFNTRCGIAAYSKHLLSQFPSEVTILAEKDAPIIEEDNSNVYRSWNVGGLQENGSFEEIKEIINKNNLSVIVIQFNYGFFNFKELEDFIFSQLNSKRLIIIEFHSTTDPKNSPELKLESLYKVLKLCHRLVVHSINDLNRMKDLGLVDNVTIFPLGIVDFNIEEKTTLENKDKFILSSYGFALPNKGLEKLVEAVKILHESGEKVYMNMFNAEYTNNPISKEVIKNVYEKIELYNLNEYVSLNTEYTSDNDVLDKLSKTDLVVYPYQQSSESSSAAVRMGIASGRTIAVSPLPIFNDVEPAVNILPGFSPKEISIGISEIIKSKRSTEHNQDILDKQEMNFKWRKSHRFSTISIKLYNFIVALQNQTYSQQ